MFQKISTAAVLLAALTIPAAAAPVSVEATVPVYTKASGITGNLNSIGSDTLNNLMTMWAEAFRAFYPNVNIQVEGKGSSTAPPALIEGTANLGPMSRNMKAEEIDKFEKKYGYKPTEIRVAIDALAVFVNKDNPVSSLTMKQVDSLFSSTYRAGGLPLVKWGKLTDAAQFKNLPISLYGRNSASGTYGFFKEHALVKGDFKSTVKEQPGSSAVVQGVGSDLGGVGYSGVGYLTSEVKAVSLGKAAGKGFEPSYENCLNGKYPLARFLLIYINKKPNAALDPLTTEFLRFVLSKEGQEAVVKDGYFPLPESELMKIRKAAGL